MQGKFLFDECLGKPMMEQLRGLIPDAPPFSHVCDFFKQGTPDNVWIPKIAKDGGYIVISADRGKKSKPADKLALLCKQFKVTHVLLGPSVLHKPAHEKVGILLAAWARIAVIAADPAGSRYVLQVKESKAAPGFRIVFKRIEEESPPRDK